jgi:hypothetical protein
MERVRQAVYGVRELGERPSVTAVRARLGDDWLWFNKTLYSVML